MPSDLQRVAQGLVDSLNQVPQVVAYLQRTANRCRENAALVVQLAGQNGATAAAQLDDAARRCEEAAHFLSMAPPKALGWAQRLVAVQPGTGGQPSPNSGSRNPLTRGAGEPASGKRPDNADRPSGGSGGGSDDGPPAPPSGSDDGPEPTPFVERIFKRLPVRSKDGDPTSGILTSPDGGRMVHVRSGHRGPGEGGPGLSGKTKDLMVARDHAEGHAAAYMRRLGMREMTLYINKEPCGYRDDARLSCDATLKYQIPPGTKLTVYWPGGRKVYIGEEGEPE